MGGPRELQIGIVVRDLDAMVEFYGDVLGLTYVSDLEFRGGIQKHFELGDARVKLVRLDEIPTLCNPPGGIAAASGLRYLTMKVDDVADAAERCAAAGHRVVVPLFEWEPGVPVAIVEDPEGTWVELLEHTL